MVLVNDLPIYDFQHVWTLYLFYSHYGVDPPIVTMLIDVDGKSLIDDLFGSHTIEVSSSILIPYDTLTKLWNCIGVG